MSNHLVDATLRAHDAGLSVIPIKSDGTKAPPWQWGKYQTKRASRAQVSGWFARGEYTGFAVIGGPSSGNLKILDFDDADTYELFVDTGEAMGLGELIGRVRSGYEERTPGGGAHLPYRCDTVEGNQKLASRPGPDPDNPRKGSDPTIETRGNGGYAIVAPSNGTVHPTGGAWALVDGDFASIAMITAAERELLFTLARSFDEIPPDEHTATSEPQTQTGGTRPGDDYRRRHGTLDAFRAIVEDHGWKLTHRRGDVGYFRRPGKDDGWSATFGHAGSDLFYVFSSSTQFEAERGYNAFRVYTVLNHAGDYAAAAKELAKQGYGDPPKRANNDGPPLQGKQDPPLNLSDLGNARRLVRAHGNDLRYCKSFGKWFVFDGGRWCDDETDEVVRRAKTTVGSIYAEAANTEEKAERERIVKHGLKSEGEARIHAMIGLAESEPGIPIRPNALDLDPWLLTAKNGTIDLRTGKLGPHQREHLITKRVPVEFNVNASCPRWLTFLESIFAGDAELISFVQRALGYSLTGITRERVLFILYGVGRNGKGTLLEVVRDILGPDYSSDTPTDTLLVKRESGIPNDIAKLRGARFVTASEVDEGRRLAEATVKKLTGGDTISARFMRGEFFDFMPAFKLWLGTNHKPDIRGTDRAIWDRLRTIPFGVRFVKPDEEPDAPAHLHADAQLREKLLAEAPGILAWVVQGCLDWQRSGLGYPTAVKDANAGYRAEMDVLRNFLDDCCVISPTSQVSTRALYAAYTRWCEANGEKPLTQTMVGKRLAERGFDQYRDMKTRGWIGVSLRPEEDTDDL